LVLAWGKKPPPAPPPPPADTLLAAIVSVLAFWVLPLVLLRLKSDAAESSPTVLTPTAKGRQMLTERGWSTGWVVFGAAASESSVKLMTSVSLLKGKDFTHVDTSFDDMPLDTQPKMGVKSDAWREVSGGYCRMPVLAIDGVLYADSDKILLKLAEDTKARPEVKSLISLSANINASAFEAIKHWGWSGLHRNMDYAMVSKEHYEKYGEGKKSAAWEKDVCKQIDTFLSTLEAKLAAKPAINGYYVGDEMTLADCALINWYLSFSAIANLNVVNRYPKVTANWQALKKKNPPGAAAHFTQFPGFGEYVSRAMKDARKRGFDINKSMP